MVAAGQTDAIGSWISGVLVVRFSCPVLRHALRRCRCPSASAFSACCMFASWTLAVCGRRLGPARLSGCRLYCLLLTDLGRGSKSQQHVTSPHVDTLSSQGVRGARPVGPGPLQLISTHWRCVSRDKPRPCDWPSPPWLNDMRNSGRDSSLLVLFSEYGPNVHAIELQVQEPPTWHYET